MHVRDVNLGRGYYESEDNYQGLKEAVETRRTFLALDHLLQIVNLLDTRVSELETKLAESEKKISATRKTVGKDESGS